MHEVLAGLLLTITLAAHQPGHYALSLAALAFALAVREFALAVALLWLVFALVERRWREASAVAALIGLFACGLDLHALAVSAHVLPDNAVSQGWSGFAGPSLQLLALSRLAFPLEIATPLALPPLLG